MNLSILARLLGAILAMLALTMAVCFLVAVLQAYRDRTDHAMFAMGVSCLITTVGSGILFFIGRKAHPDELLRKEAIAVVGLGWILAAAFGALPFWLFGQDVTWIQAFFESMSGFTTTGSTIFPVVENMPDSILLWRSLTQWIGGLGILALFVALLSTLGVGGKSLVGAETSMNLGDSPTARTRDLALRLWIVYTGITLVCWLSLWLAGQAGPVKMSVFHALLYSLTAVSTGGFAPHDTSVAHFDSPVIEIVLCVFMIICSLSMVLVVNMVSGNFLSKTGRTEAYGLLALVLFAWAAVTVDLWLNHQSSGWGAAREALFPIVSLSSSTGFGTVDYDQWPLLARCTLILLMAVGGCSGSTAGGVKMVRLIIMLSILRQEISKTFRPKRVFAIRLDGRKVETDAQWQVLTYLVFVGMLILLSTVFVSVLEPSVKTLDTAFGAVFATFFNMGPGFGEVGPTDNFAHFHQSTLLFLSLLMLLGRLEVFVLMALFSRSLWTKH